MEVLLFFTGMFVIAMAIAAVLCRFKEAKSARQSDEAKQRKREAARRSAESDRKAMNWAAVISLSVFAIIAVLSLLSDDPDERRLGLAIAGIVALPILKLWAMANDDGLNPRQPRKPQEPGPASAPPPAAQEPRRP